ncbi:MAG: serine/threonine protein kinase, partial [Acidobacteriota bacterium]|nr:serine/threonine protein kinase [Acidobacteriota bacterium]
VYDYGALNTEGAYLVMELVEGETLGSLLKRKKYISPTLAAEWFEQILAAVGAAHSGGVVHRDLKPENIFIVRAEGGDASIKVLDFGLAKFTQPAAAESPSSTTAAGPVTTPGAVMGTLGYMAPEQLTGGAVDERSDLFSVGVIIVEAITGQRPFNGKTYHELLTAILQHPFHLPAGAPAVQQLDDVLQKCLAKDRQKRFASAAALRQELIPALRACPPLLTAMPANLEADTFILKT